MTGQVALHAADWLNTDRPLDLADFRGWVLAIEVIDLHSVLEHLAGNSRESHRGGANDEGEGRGIMEYFSPAVQIGLAATPRSCPNADTDACFGDPVSVSDADKVADMRRLIDAPPSDPSGAQAN